MGSLSHEFVSLLLLRCCCFCVKLYWTHTTVAHDHDPPPASMYIPQNMMSFVWTVTRRSPKARSITRRIHEYAPNRYSILSRHHFSLVSFVLGRERNNEPPLRRFALLCCGGPRLPDFYLIIQSPPILFLTASMSVADASLDSRLYNLYGPIQTDH